MKQRFSKRTRLVSALLTLAMVFTFLPFSAFAVAGGDLNVPLDNFPDETFREYLRTKYDKDENGALNTEERNNVKTINVWGRGITTLEGIQHFPKLENLYCYKNQLTNLDVSKNPELKQLWCYNNPLTKLDVSRNAELKELWCSDNKLSSLDVSKNPKLENLDCYKNQLTELDVSKNTALRYLDCRQNSLTSLDVSQTVVTTLKASGNKIDINVETTPRTFDLSKLPGKFEVSKASGWVGGTVSGSTLTVDEGATEVTYTYDCGKGLSETFTLNVNVVPDGSTGGGSTGGTTPGGSTGGSSGGGGGGGGAIIVVAGAAAVGLVGYGIYNYVAERQLQALLPEGAAIPENRAQTALLLWNTAGRPEPAAQPAFPDVADPDTAKAAQWCVEHGLMNAKLRGRFAPDGSSPAYKTLNAYRQLVG